MRAAESALSSRAELGDGLHPVLRGLTKLAHLTSLTVAWCRPASSLRVLSALQTLRHLDVSKWPFPTKADALTALTRLTTLRLRDMYGLRLGPLLGSLTDLQHLTLLECGIAPLASLRWASSLHTLRSLQVQRLLHAPCPGAPTARSVPAHVCSVRRRTWCSSLLSGHLRCIEGAYARWTCHRRALTSCSPWSVSLELSLAAGRNRGTFVSVLVQHCCTGPQETEHDRWLQIDVRGPLEGMSGLVSSADTLEHLHITNCHSTLACRAAIGDLTRLTHLLLSSPKAMSGVVHG